MFRSLCRAVFMPGLALACISASAAHGATNYWISESLPHGDWHNPSNWSLGRVPSASDDVVCNLAQTGQEILVTTQASARTLNSTRRITIIEGDLRIVAGGTVYSLYMPYIWDPQPTALRNEGVLHVTHDALFGWGKIYQPDAARLVFDEGCGIDQGGFVEFQGGVVENNGSFNIGTNLTLGRYDAVGLPTVFLTGPHGTTRVLGSNGFRDQSTASPPHTGGQSVLLNQGRLEFFGYTDGDAGDIEADIALSNENGAEVIVDRTAIAIERSGSVISGGYLQSGNWTIRNGGRFLHTASIHTISPGVQVTIEGSGSTFAGLQAITANWGSLTAANAGILTLAPASGTLTNYGSLAIGPRGNINILGNLQLNSVGALHYVVNGLYPYDTGSLNVSGTALFGGRFVADFYDPTLIRPGDEYTFAVHTGGAGQLSGQFSSVEVYPPDPARHSVAMTPEYASLLFSRSCPGDIDGDGMVGLADIAYLISWWGSATPPAPRASDQDGDESLGLGDTAQVILHWGESCP